MMPQHDNEGCAAMEVDEKPPEEDKQPVVVFSLNALQLVRLAQAQHGLRHGDYTRYRHYCSKRLRTLYKKLKLLHGRQKFQKKRIEPSGVTSERYLHVPLISAERSWAHAMDLKKEIENPPRRIAQSGKRQHLAKGDLEKMASVAKRRHMLARLKKASCFGAEFASLCSVRGDAKTALEAEGYASMMAGRWMMEQGSDWHGARCKLLRAKKLFEELAKVGEFDQQALFHQVLEELEPSVRFCKYNIERKEGAPVQLQEVDLQQLESKLASLVVEAKSQAQQEQTASSLVWRGMKYPVRSEKLRDSLQQAVDLEEQLHVAEDQLATYDKVVSAYSDLKSLVRQALNAGGGTNTLGLSSDLDGLAMAVSGTLLQYSIQRSLLLLQQEEANFEQGLLLSLQSSRRSKDKGSRPKPGDVVRQHDTIIGHLTELIELGMKIGGAQGEVLMEEYAAKAAHYRASRCYYVAHVHFSGKRFREAHALFQRCIRRVEEAVARYKECAQTDEKALEELMWLSERAAANRCAARAEFAVETLREEQNAREGMDALDLGDQKDLQQNAKDAAPGTRYLSDNLDSWESFVGPGKSVRIFRIPPPLYSMPVKPIMLDTAFSHIERPNLDHRLPKKTSTFSRMFAWTGWK